MLRIAVSLTALTLFMFAGHAQAKRNYGMAGCGLGSLLISPSGSQSSAATTNASTYSQSFGISLGTSNCMSDEEAAIILEQEDFIVANLGTLSKEMSQGNGTALVAFSESLGCDQAVFPQFAETLQGNYQDIFAAPGALAVLDTAKEHLKLDATLNAKCRLIHI